MTLSLLRRAGLVAGATGGLLLVAAAPASAHETWFVHHPGDYPVDAGELLRPVVLAGLAAVVLATLAWRAVAGRVGTPELPQLHRLSALVPWVPRLLAAHLGLSLLLLVLGRAALDPGVPVPDGALGTALLLPQAVAGALLLAGRLVRPAAWAVVAAGPVLLALSGPRSLLTCLALLGIALLLVACPPSPARAMLDQRPVLNLLSPLGVDADGFALVAGLVEVLFAALVLSGAAPQVVALVAAVPFTASLLVFGGTELIGHLPVYGVLLTLLVLGSDARTAPLVRAFARPDVQALVPRLPVRSSR